MRAILVLMFLFALVTTVKAQVSSVTGQYLQDNNILLNPGFESGIGKWVNSAGTFSIDYTNFIQGKASGKVVLSSQALAFTQDSTTYVTALADGVQGLVSVYIKSNFAAKVCSRSAGVTSSTNCVDVIANNKWALYKVPSILGATSNGISINTNGTSVTGTIYIDESFVGITDLAADVDASRIAGEAYFAGTSSCTWTRTSATVGAFTTAAACPGPTIVEQNLGQWQTTDSDLPRVTVNNLPAGKYKATYYLQTINSSSIASVYTINDGTTTCEPIANSSSATDTTQTVVSCVFSYNSLANRVFEIYAGSATGSVNISNTRTAPRGSVKFQLEYFGSSSVYTSTNADTDWAACNFSTLAWQGLGTVTNNLQCKRHGSDLVMRGRFTVGAPTASEARIPLPLWNGSQLSTTAAIATTEIAGFAHRNALTTTQYGILSEASVAYLTMDAQSGGTAGLTKQNGSTLFGTGDIVSFTARVPISGWENSNIIIGQFNGLESCTDSYECTDVFSANVSSGGTVSNENIDWINGNISPSSNLYPISFKTGVFTVAPNCVATATSTSIVTIQEYTAATNSGVTMATIAGGAGSPQAFKIICQKQGVGKTAKAVASDQNVASPGTIKSTLCSAKISSTGVITDQKGGCFASCTNATTPVCTFTSSYWVAGQIPNCWGITDTAGTSTGNATTASSTELAVRVIDSTFATVSGARRYFCHGERQ